MKWLDPPFFSHLILALYALNVVHHAIGAALGRISVDAGIFGAAYWASAFAITATVTFLAPR